MTKKRAKEFGFGTKIVKCFLASDELFKSVKNESMVKTFLFYAFLGFVFLLLNFLTFFFSGSFPALKIASYFGSLAGLTFGGIFVLLFVLLLVFNFILASVYHLFVKLMGGKSGFSATFKAISYGFIPAALLGWIPLIGIFISIHYFYLNVRGIAILHEISMRRAFWALFLPVLIAILLLSIFLATFLVQILTFVKTSTFLS